MATIRAQIAAPDCIDDNDKGEERRNTKNQAIRYNIDCELFVEDSRNNIVRRTIHDITSNRLETKAVDQLYRT